MKLLRQSTATTLLLGPFVDETDGQTAETGLTISQADVLLWKEGGTTLAQKNEATTCTHRSNGLYTCPLNTTDTNTLGILTVSVDESGALPVRHDYQVVPANVYDALVLGTDVLQVDVSQFGNSNGTFSGGRPEVNTTHAAGTAWGSGAITAASIASDAITAAKIADNAIDAGSIATGAITSAKFAAGAIDAAAIATNAIDADALAADAIAEINATVDTALADIHLDHLLAVDYDPAAKPGVATALLNELVESDGGVSRFTANALEQGPSGGGSDVFVLRTGTAQAGAVGSITLDAGAPTTNDRYKSNIVFITSGTGAGQSRYISGYDGTTKVATVAPDFVIAPDNTSVFVIAPFGTDPATIESIVTEVWAAQRSTNQVVGSFGERVLADMTHLSGNATAADNAKDVFLTAPGALAVDVAFVNGVEVIGDGTDGNPWRAVGT